MGWSRGDLAKAANVGRNTVLRFEQGHDLHDSTRLAIRRRFEQEGFRFPDGATLVRERRPAG